MSKFDTAFAAARKAGKQDFTFGGKKYNTKLKGEKFAKTPEKAPVPTAKPVARSRFSPKTEMSEAAKNPANRPVQMNKLLGKADRLTGKTSRLKKTVAAK